MPDEEVLKAIAELKQNLRSEIDTRYRVRDRKWFVGPLVSIIVIIAGILINWGVMTTQIDHLEKMVEANQTRTFENQLNVMNLRTEQQVSKATTEAVLKNMEDKVNEISKDMKRLLSRRHY